MERLDLEKSCDRVYWKGVWEMMKMYDAGGSTVGAVKSLKVDKRERFSRD